VILFMEGRGLDRIGEVGAVGEGRSGEDGSGSERNGKPLEKSGGFLVSV